MVSTKIIAGGIAMGADYALRNWDKIENAISGLKGMLPADAKFKQQFATLQADVEGMRADLADKTARLAAAEQALAAERRAGRIRMAITGVVCGLIGLALPFALHLVK